MSTSILHRYRPALWLAAAAVWAGCSGDEPRDALGPEPGNNSAPLAVHLEASSANTPVGGKVALAVHAASPNGQRLGGIQGTLYFDKDRLKYLGQPTSGAFAIVNSSKAAQGELRVASL